jgi:hypothetical protein
MKYQHVLLCLVCCVLLFSSCSSIQSSVFNARKVRSCTSVCHERLVECSKVCHNNNIECIEKAKCRAVYHYERYVHEQEIQGRVAPLELNSYRDPLQCRKTACNCYADNNVCVQSCKGRIHKSLQIGPACC